MKRQRPCEHCDDGLLWENETTGELTCDTCHAVCGLRETVSEARRQQRERERRQSRREHDEYDNSGRTRLYGGYYGAYLSENGSEYAIDAYGEITQGLCTPHLDGWRQRSTA